MLSKGSERLADDHVALDQLLKQLQAALDEGDVNVVYASLDLFWAKLAVHIRAEHLHLFPGVLKESSETAGLGDTRAAIVRLRADHDFFMHQLARAVETIRGLLHVSDQPVIDKELDTIRSAISDVEQRLADHNRIEENHIYQLAGTILNVKQQEELARRISSELENRPPRFAANLW
jgi:hemerythrin superfamily protein